MLDQGSGSIVNIASMSGMVSRPSSTARSRRMRAFVLSGCRLRSPGALSADHVAHWRYTIGAT